MGPFGPPESPKSALSTPLIGPLRLEAERRSAAVAAANLEPTGMADISRFAQAREPYSPAYTASSNATTELLNPSAAEAREQLDQFVSRVRLLALESSYYLKLPGSASGH